MRRAKEHEVFRQAVHRPRATRPFPGRPGTPDAGARCGRVWRRSSVSYEIRIKEVPDQLVASVSRRASMSTVGKEVPEAFRELSEAVAPIGFGAGMPGIVYYGEVGPQTEWDMEIFMPVAAAFEPPEGIKVRILSGTTCASIVHRGPYEEVGPAYDALAEWIADHRHQVAGPPRELYLNDPNEVGQDAALTEIVFPIR